MATANARLLAQIADQVDPTGALAPLRPRGSAAGGCLHDTLCVATAHGTNLFIKTTTGDQADLLAQEAAGLQQLRVDQGPRVPQVFGSGVAEGRAWLALEWIDLQRRGDAAELGRALARLHQHSAERFGAAHDNYIGTTPQPNGWYADWAAFWRECRLGPQLERAARSGHKRLAERGWHLAEHIESLLADHRPQPSLLHGDLWAGNAAYDHSGQGVVFDPATYYGDREADIAMTELFGGFSTAFYAGYRELWPLAPGYEQRRELYNLYHMLNHAHLFGGGYVHNTERLTERLLTSAR